MIKQGLIVSAGTFVSRLLGLARDIALAYFFGVSGATDAFFVAFKIPNFFRRLFAEGSFSQAFIPVLSEYSVKKNPVEVMLLLQQTISWLLVFLLPLTLFGVIGNQWLIKLYAMGFHVAVDQARFILATDLVQITFPYLLLISITAFFAAILQTYNHFALPSLAPIWLNICFLVALFFGPSVTDEPIYALAWAVLAAGMLQLLFLLPSLLFIRRLPIPCWPRRHSGVRRIMRLMVPTLFAVSVHQCNLLIDMQLAAFLTLGSISWLSYGDRIMSFPLALIGVAVATVILPTLSKDFTTQALSAFRLRLTWGGRVVLLIGVPAAVGIVLLAPYILVTLFYYGPLLTITDIENIAAALRGYAIGLPGFMLVKVATAAFFSQHNATYAVKIGVITVAVNIVLSVLLSQYLDHVGLALSTAIAGITNAVLLWFGLHTARLITLSAQQFRFGLRLVGAVCFMTVVMIYILPSLDTFIAASWWWRCILLTAFVLLGVISYAISIWFFGVRATDFTFLDAVQSAEGK